MIPRIVESFLRPFDNEQSELIVRWRLWKSQWFPYRTAELLGYDETADDLLLGPWVWHRPRRWQNRHSA